MRKFSLKEKLAIITGISLVTIFSYFAYQSRDYKEKIIYLNNKEFLGKSWRGLFDSKNYYFMSPPPYVDGVPRPSFEVYQGKSLNSNSNLIKLQSYEKHNNAKLEYRVEENHPEYQTRQDTSEILFNIFNE